MTHRRAVARACLAAALCLLLAAPLAAYTIYLKDGTRMQAKEKYRVVNGQAMITLPNGTRGVLDVREIDVKRTEEANRVDYGGNAVVVETPQEPAAPPPTTTTTAPPPTETSTTVAGGDPAVPAC